MLSLQNSLKVQNKTSLSVNDLSLLSRFDDFYLQSSEKIDEILQLENTLLKLSEETGKLFEKWKISLQRCCTLKELIDHKTQDFIEVENCLNKATQMMNDEREKRQCYEKDVENYKIIMATLIKQVLKDNHSHPNSVTESILDAFCPCRRSLNESIVQTKLTFSNSSSDSSYIRFEEDLDSSKYTMCGKRWKTVQATSPMRKYSEHEVRMTSTKVEFQDYALTHDNIIKDLIAFTGGDPNNKDGYNLQPKTIIIPENCNACRKKIKFGKTALKCKLCKAFYHPDCSFGKYVLCLKDKCSIK